MCMSLRVDANTILTLLGSHCKNNSWRKAPSALGVSPVSCCKQRSSWVGLWLPNSSGLNSCCRCLLIKGCCPFDKCFFEDIIRCFCRQCKNQITFFCGEFGCQWSDCIVIWFVIPRVENWACTCASHNWGSDGQKGRSLTETAASCGCPFSSVIAWFSVEHTQTSGSPLVAG